MAPCAMKRLSSGHLGWGRDSRLREPPGPGLGAYTVHPSMKLHCLVRVNRWRTERRDWKVETQQVWHELQLGPVNPSPGLGLCCVSQLLNLWASPVVLRWEITVVCILEGFSREQMR